MAGMGSFVPPVMMEVVVNAKEAIASLGEINAQLTTLGARAEATGAKLTAMEKSTAVANQAFKVLSVGAGAFGVIAVESAIKAQEAFARLDTALKNTGNGSAATAEEMKKLSENNTNLGFTTQATAGALGTLVTATHNTHDATKLLNTAMDLARYKHIDLGTAATILARGTQGSAKAFKEMGITLDTNLPKQEAINKAMDQLNAKLSGQNAAYLETFAGKISVLSANFEKIAEEVGNVLIPAISGVLGFIIKFKTEIEILTGVILGAVIAFKAYTTVMNLFKAAQIIYIALTTGSAAAQTALTFATEGGAAATKSMAAAQWLLNVAMNANPIGLIIAAVTVLIAVLYELWKHSNTVRNALVDVAIFGVRAVADLIHWFGEFAQTVLKVVTGPMKLMLEALAFIHAPGAKTALNDLNGAIKTVGTFFDKTAKSVDNYTISLQQMKRATSNAGMQVMDSTSTADTSGYDLSNYSGANKSGAASKAARANQKIVNEVTALQKQLTTAVDKYNKAIEKAHADYTDAITKADTDFANKKKQLDADWQKKQEELLTSHKDNLIQIDVDYANKLKAVIQKSIAELTNAFASATKTDIGTMFSDMQKAGDYSTEALLTSMKDKLAKIKQLATDASTLAAKGFNQAFIQQVVAQGPDMGDQLTKSILASSPEQVTQMQSLFTQLTDASNNGVTQLATAMSQPGKLASDALNAEYAQTLIDQQDAIKKENEAYQKAFDDAKAIYDTAIADNLTTQQKAYDEANKALMKATATAEGELAVSLAKIQETFTTKLGKVNTTVQSTIALINELVTAMAIAGISGATGSTIATSKSGKVVTSGGSVVSNEYLNTLHDFMAKERADTAASAPVIGSLTQNVYTNDPSLPTITTGLTNVISLGQTQGLTSKPLVVSTQR
jgi:hypothetical protein